MLNKIKNKLKSDDNKKLLSNFFSLFILQGANYILPLITIPYLVRVLGPEKFGLVAFALSFIMFFLVFVDYGFILTATKNISINQNNKQKLSEIFSSVLIIKSIFIFISFIVLSLIIFSFSKFQNEIEIYYITFLYLLGYSFFPIWFFQGIEKMKYITYFNISIRLIYVILIFSFVKKETDYLLVPLFNGLSFIFIAIVSIIFIVMKMDIKFVLPKYTVLVFYIKDGFHVFLSNLTTTSYTIATPFILGIFTNNVIVGYYSASEKIIKAIQGLMQPIFQTTYPHISKLVEKSKDEALDFIRLMTKFVFIFTFISSSLTYIFADKIILLFLGEQYIDSIVILKILSFLPFVGSLNNMFGIQTMQTFGKKKEHLKIIALASFLFLLVAFYMVPRYDAIGSALSLIFVETLIPILMFIFLQKNNFKII